MRGNAAILLFVFVMFFSVPANATLIDRGSGLIYCDVLDVTWLSNADLGGSMNWYEAMDWADQLVYMGFENWRLPRANEMNHLFYNELGGSRSVPIIHSSDPDLNLFYNIAPSNYAHLIDPYWSPDNNPRDSGLAITFGFNNTYMSGAWAYEHKSISYGHAWGVIDSDVAAPVPEPSTLILMGIGLAGIVGLGRKNIINS